MSAGVKKILWKTAQVIVIGLIFYYIGRRLIVNWQQVEDFDWHINVYYIAAALVSVIVTFFVFSSVWRLIVLSLNKRVSFRKSFKIAYLANLGRYIPGKIWQMFGMIYLAKKEGVTEEEAVTSFGLTQIFAIPSGLLSGLVFLAIYPGALARYSDSSLISTGIMIGGDSHFSAVASGRFFPASGGIDFQSHYYSVQAEADPIANEQNACGDHLWGLFSGVESVRFFVLALLEGHNCRGDGPAADGRDLYHSLSDRLFVFAGARRRGAAGSYDDHDAGSVFRTRSSGGDCRRLPIVVDSGRRSFGVDCLED